MKSIKRILFTLLVGSIVVRTAAWGAETDVQRARAALESSATAYREVVALRDRLSYVVTAPGAEQETKVEEYAFGPGGAVSVKNALLEAVALDSKMYLTQSDVPDRYIVTTYDGDFGAALRRVAGQGSLFEPPSPSVRARASTPAWMPCASISSHRCASQDIGR